MPNIYHQSVSHFITNWTSFHCQMWKSITLECIRYMKNYHCPDLQKINWSYKSNCAYRLLHICALFPIYLSQFAYSWLISQLKTVPCLLKIRWSHKLMQHALKSEKNWFSLSKEKTEEEWIDELSWNNITLLSYLMRSIRCLSVENPRILTGKSCHLSARRINIVGKLLAETHL